MNLETLLKLIRDDDLGLLEVKKKSSDIQSADSRLIASFQEINQFIFEMGREPKANISDVREFSLNSRLKYFRDNINKFKVLVQYDNLGLLGFRGSLNSIEDIFNDDDLGIFNKGSDSIFDIQHIPKETNDSAYIARRKSCLDFKDFEEHFKLCQKDLAVGKRKLWPFAKEQQINEGEFFVLKGILTYIAEVGVKEKSNGKMNARLRCIFENKTESNMLLRSLARELYRDGRRVLMNVDNVFDGRNITSKDKVTGYIYVLKSLSENPEIKSIHHLHKIGFSRISVEERIKNASKEATYLFDSVQLISTSQCFNTNTQKLEWLLHKFFENVCLNIEIFDSNGQKHKPREWFIAPFDIIDQAITFFLNGKINNYRYDSDRQIIVGR